MIARTRPSLDHPDVTQVRLISRAWDDEEQCEFVCASIPSRRDSEVRYLVEGHTHGRDGTCSCLGYRRWRRCCHQAAWPLILEELEKQHYLDDHRYSVAGLVALLDFYAASPTPLNDEQRLRRNGVRAALQAHGIRYESTRTLAEQQRVAERAAKAQSELFG